MQNEKEILDSDQMIGMHPQNLKITVSGKVASGKTTLLSIIKDCLERDYYFRTHFAGFNIQLDEKVEDVEDRVKDNNDTL